MSDISYGAEVVMASLAMRDQMPKGGEAQELVAMIMRDLPNEVDELVNCGFLRREGDDLIITEKGKSYADKQIEKAMASEASSQLEPGSAAFVMRLAFDFDTLTCVRQLLVPTHITFEEFHTIIQATMNWMNYHLYDFALTDKDGNVLAIAPKPQPGPLPFIDAMWDTEDEGERIDVATVYLDDYFPEVGMMAYNYDYGDGWCILVECLGEAKLEEGFPVCLAGTGDAPPEDVGGEWGFQEFLQTASDPNDPEHDDMLQWAVDQGYEPFSLPNVNARLRMWRNYTAMDPDSSGTVADSGSLQGDGNEASLMDSYDVQVEKNRKDNAHYLSLFEEWLTAQQLSQKTVRKHISNMDLYLNYYLNYYEATQMPDGAWMIGGFLGDWFIRKAWGSKSGIKGFGATLKKFYKCMYEKGSVSSEGYRFVLDDVKNGMEGWLRALEKYEASPGWF